MQTNDEQMDLNEAMFRVNGGVGYVLKPAALMGNRSASRPVEFTVTVISGQCLPSPDSDNTNDIVDPYVIVEVFGHARDQFRAKTRPIRNNGFNPEWRDNNTFTFTVRRPELAFVRFCVRDHSMTGADQFVGEYSVMADAIRVGYAHLPLRTGFRHLPDPTATLFVHCKRRSLTCERPAEQQSTPVGLPSLAPKDEEHAQLNRTEL